jgi:carboxyl-terminal processing protease
MSSKNLVGIFVVTITELVGMVTQGRITRLISWLMVSGTLLYGRATLASAEQPAPNKVSRVAAKLTAALLTREHFSQPSLNDELLRRWFGLYLKTLDPRKLYFRQSDVDEFRQHENKLDDWVREGQVDFACRVSGRLAERMQERTEAAAQILAHPPDFSVDEQFPIDPQRLRYLQRIGVGLDITQLHDAVAQPAKRATFTRFRQRV